MSLLVLEEGVGRVSKAAEGWRPLRRGVEAEEEEVGEVEEEDEEVEEVVEGGEKEDEEDGAGRPSGGSATGGGRVREGCSCVGSVVEGSRGAARSKALVKEEGVAVSAAARVVGEVEKEGREVRVRGVEVACG